MGANKYLGFGVFNGIVTASMAGLLAWFFEATGQGRKPAAHFKVASAEG